MKFTITIIAVLLMESGLMASDTTLLFRQINYAQVFDQAKEEGKSVMLYFHFDGCGACLKMESNVFIDRHVADFYDTNFICFEINTRKGEGIETNKIYNVQLHPTFLYLDENGDTLSKIVGIFSPEEFIRQGQYALDPETSIAALKKQYSEGRRDAEFLYKFCYRLNSMHELDSMTINEYLDTQKPEDFGKEENIRFIYEFAVHNFKITMPYSSAAFNFINGNREKFYQYFDKEQVDTRIVWIINAAVYEATNKQDEQLFERTLELIKEFDTGKNYEFHEMDGRWTGVLFGKDMVLNREAAYYSKAGLPDKENVALQLLVEKYWDDYYQLNEMAWNYYLEFDDGEKLQVAIKWIKRSIHLNSNYNNNDTYAALLYKTGYYHKALKVAGEAIELAKEQALNYKETESLVEKIKAAQR